MLKELFQLPYVYFGKDMEPSVGREAAIGYEAMEMRVKVNEIAVNGVFFCLP